VVSPPLDTLSSLLGLPDPSTGRGFRRAARLALEGAFYTALALAVAHGIRAPQSGFFAIFLAAAGLATRLDGLLDANRAAILERSEPPLQVNAGTAAGLLSLFLGSFAAFAAFALGLGERALSSDFGFVGEATGLAGTTLLTRSFGSAPGLLLNNLGVLALFVGLAFIYRSYGALLALTWNACLWGLTLAFLARRAMTDAVLPAPAFVAVAFLAVLPHLVLEAAGYVMGTLGGIFASRALARHAPGDPLLRSALRSSGLLALAAMAFLAAGALLEAALPGQVLRLLER
jgi:hypothetical protein